MPAPPSAELEGIEIRAYLDVCRASPVEIPRTRIGSALAVVMPGLQPNLGRRVVGLGVEAPASPHDVDAAIDWMTARTREYTVTLAPAARPSRLLEMLVARGFVPGYAWAKLHRDASAPPEVDAPFDLRLATEVRDADDFTGLVRDCFGAAEAFQLIARALVGREGWHVVLARDGGDAVGCGVLFSRGPLGWMGFAATLPSHRGRGVQRAIIGERIRIARRLGLATIAVETGVRREGWPEASLRNLEWAGFREAYVRANLLSPALTERSVSPRAAG